MEGLTSSSIIVTKDCNMQCPFCYEKMKNSKVMDIPTAKRAIDYIAEHREPDALFTFMWIGGEPMLNFDVIKAGIEYAEEIGFEKCRHVIITNGTLFGQELEDLMLAHRNIKIQISWQGIPELQDESRGCSALLEENIKRAVSLFPGRIFIKMVILPSNVNRLYETFMYMLDVLKDPKYINVRPAFEYDEWKDNGLLNVLCEEAYKIAKVSYFPLTDPVGLQTNRIFRCDLTQKTLSFGVDGTITPCTRTYFLPDAKKFDLGTLDNPELKEIDIIKTYLETGRDKCDNCYANELCTICPIQTYEETGTLTTPTNRSCGVMKAFAFGLQRAMFDEIISKVPDNVNEDGLVDMKFLEDMSWKKLLELH